jgi:serine/threonine-protein kinase
MGVVWKAEDTSLGRPAAIKVLPDLLARDPERVARFEREARLLASLNHPHVASIYGFQSADNVRFLAMEFVEGLDLSQRISQGPVPLEEALALARQIAEALEHAHEKGIIHRDLKPANVKLSAAGVKVLDSIWPKPEEDPRSASRPCFPTPTITATTAANVFSTAAYMSRNRLAPEADRRAGIWA